MKFTVKKIIALMIALAFSAGALFVYCGFGRGLPRGVFVDGVDVGGLTKEAAVSAVRRVKEDALKQKELNIYADERVYTYKFPEFYYSDNLSVLLGGIKRKGEYYSKNTVYLNGLDEIVSSIRADVECSLKEPYAQFNRAGEPFTYYAGNDGISLDGDKLAEDINASLNGGFWDVTANISHIPRSQTVENVKRGTVQLYSFSTYFDPSNSPRAYNIKLASSKINGVILLPDEVLSFNATVGERTEERGFKTAKIIEGGKFVDGVGGGVCQVSTTLYNAALLSGLEILEYHPHSLAVSYVAPSRDAMVSGNYFDLKIKNNRQTPVYIRMNANFSSVSCTVYGTDDGYKYSFISKVTGSIPRPQDTVVEGDCEKVITNGRDGTLSEGYLCMERDGYTKTYLLRRDKYSAVGEVRQIINQKQEDELENVG